jgi:RimJ/RimL family protein N-acetyltransferase
LGTLEFIPATRRLLRLLSSDPEEFAVQYKVRLHELAQPVASHSLAFMRTFPHETPPDWFGYLVVNGETQELVGTCTFKGPPAEGAVEIACFTFPGFEGRGIGTAMARFLLERARTLPDVSLVTARTASDYSAATRILEKIGMQWAGEEVEEGETVWRWEIANVQ